MLVETTACQSWRGFLRHSVEDTLRKEFYFLRQYNDTGYAWTMLLIYKICCVRVYAAIYG